MRLALIDNTVTPVKVHVYEDQQRVESYDCMPGVPLEPRHIDALLQAPAEPTKGDAA